MVDNINEAYSIFQQPWWLDATAPGRWDEVRIEEGGKTVARLPFTVREKFGVRVLGQPALTQTLGPWIEPLPDERPDRRLAREKDLFSKLIQKLPKHDVFRQNFSPEITNWLPFHWKGFSQTTKYTYALDLDTSPDELLRNMSKNTRKRVRKAERELAIEKSRELGPLLRLSKMTFRRQGLLRPYSDEYLERIDIAVKSHGFRSLRVAYGRTTGQEHAAAYAIGCQKRVYMLVSGADPALRASGAGYGTKWATIRDASDASRIFDFEGSMLEGVELFNRSFGATQIPYFNITNSNIIGRSAEAGRRIAGAVYRWPSSEIPARIRKSRA